MLDQVPVLFGLGTLVWVGHACLGWARLFLTIFYVTLCTVYILSLGAHGSDTMYVESTITLHITY